MRYLILISLSLLIFSCKEEETKRVAVYIDADIKPASINDTVNGRVATLNAFRLYLSHIRLVTTSGDTLPVSDYFLYEYPVHGNSEKIAEIDADGKSIQKILFSVGLDPELNNSDPVTFPAGHPLSLDKDMYWGMLKYRFLVTEGAFDSTASMTGSPTFPFSLHLGSDTLYRENSFVVSGGNIAELHIRVDPFAMYYGYGEIPLDMRMYYSNHSSPAEIPDAIELMDNFVSRISIQKVIFYSE